MKCFMKYDLLDLHFLKHRPDKLAGFVKDGSGFILYESRGYFNNRVNSQLAPVPTLTILPPANEENLFDTHEWVINSRKTFKGQFPVPNIHHKLYTTLEDYFNLNWSAHFEIDPVETSKQHQDAITVKILSDQEHHLFVTLDGNPDPSIPGDKFKSLYHRVEEQPVKVHHRQEIVISDGWDYDWRLLFRGSSSKQLMFKYFCQNICIDHLLPITQFIHPLIDKYATFEIDEQHELFRYKQLWKGGTQKIYKNKKNKKKQVNRTSHTGGTGIEVLPIMQYLGGYMTMFPYIAPEEHDTNIEALIALDMNVSLFFHIHVNPIFSPTYLYMNAPTAEVTRHERCVVLKYLYKNGKLDPYIIESEHEIFMIEDTFTKDFRNIQSNVITDLMMALENLSHPVTTLKCKCFRNSITPYMLPLFADYMELADGELWFTPLQPIQARANKPRRTSKLPTQRRPVTATTKKPWRGGECNTFKV